MPISVHCLGLVLPMHHFLWWAVWALFFFWEVDCSASRLTAVHFPGTPLFCSQVISNDLLLVYDHCRRVPTAGMCLISVL